MGPLEDPVWHGSGRTFREVGLSLSLSFYLSLAAAPSVTICSAPSGPPPQDETFDAASMPDQIQHFIERLTVLFEKGQAYELPSYTKIALDLLEHPVVIFTKKGPRTLGGPGTVTASLKRRCMARMMTYVKIAVAVSKAEFPHYELMASFRVLHLTKIKATSADKEYVRNSPTYKGDLERLAQVFKLDIGLLEMQLDYSRPFAQKALPTCDYDNQEAWKVAFNVLTGQRRNSKTVSIHGRLAELSAVLERFTAFGASTGGVERTFSSRARLLLCKQFMSDHRDVVTLKVALERRPDEEAKVVELAREFWSPIYGLVRASSKKKKMTAGVPKRKFLPTKKNKKKKADNTETEFIRCRRKAVSDAICDGADTVHNPRKAQRRHWSNKHSKVLDAQLAKATKRKLQGFEMGQMLASEVTDDMEASAKAEQKKRKANMNTRDRKRKRSVKTILSPKDFIDQCNNKNVFAEAMVLDRGLERVIVSRGMHFKTSRLQAEIFVVDVVDKAGLRTKWAAAIVGGWLVSADVLNKQKGAFVKYGRACGVHKEIWFSEKAQTKHSEVYQIVKGAVELEGSKWLTIASRAAFIERYTKAVKSHRGPNVIAVVSSNDAEVSICFSMSCVSSFFFPRPLGSGLLRPPLRFRPSLARDLVLGSLSNSAI